MRMEWAHANIKNTPINLPTDEKLIIKELGAYL